MTWDIPQRNLELVITYARKEENLNFKLKNNQQTLDIQSNIIFDTSASVSGAVSELNLTIGGMTPAQMQELATSVSFWSNPIIYNKIELYGGYDNNKGTIFTGNIVEAVPNLNNANYNIQIRALSSFTESIKKSISIDKQGEVKVEDICKELANKIKYKTLTDGTAGNIVLENYSYSNQPITNHLRYLSSLTGLEIYIEGQAIIYKKPGQPLKGVKEYTIDSNNLIGIIKPTTQGFECDVRLDPSVRTGTPVKVKNYTFQRLNTSSYTIMSYSHNGKTRGNDWKTHIWCVNPEFYLKNIQ